MQRKKSAEELLYRVWWNKSDIRTVLGCSKQTAAKLWELARANDDTPISMVVEPTKAKADKVCKAYGTTLTAEQNKLKKRVLPAS